jgi:Ribose 5-phosphate isomerase
VAGIAETVIWIMDESKLVDKIGAFPLPVEILPFGYTHVMRRLNEIAINPTLRIRDGNIFITDNGNYIVDMLIKKTFGIQEIHERLNSITGVVETGLFLNMCKRIIIGTGKGIKIVENPSCAI